MDVAAKAKALYERYLDDEQRVFIESLDVPDQTYLWARMYYEIPRQLGETMLRDMEQNILRGEGKARLRGLFAREAREIKSLDDLWDTTRPHSWFRTGL